MRVFAFTGLSQAFVLVSPVRAAAVMAIESPMDYQVFQWQTRAAGKILVKGGAQTECDRVEARVHSVWMTVPYDRSSRTFRGELAAGAGGFYEVDVRLVKSGKTLGERTVPHVGVGEVLVIAGQANSINYSEARQETKSGMVTSFDGHSWRIANDPQLGVQDASSKGSFIPPLAKRCKTTIGCPSGLQAWAMDPPASANGCRKRSASPSRPPCRSTSKKSNRASGNATARCTTE